MNEVSAQIADTSSMSLQTFVQGAMHEIANPLSSISMGAEVAKMMLQRGQTTEVVELLDRIISDCSRCARLLQGMQRFGAGLQSHTREVVGARDFIESAIKLFRADHRERELQITIEMVDSPNVQLDRPTFEHAYMDLLLNALEAGASEVQISIRKDAGFVSFCARDNGKGISADAIARSADPFFSTRRGEGKCGLGLTLIRDLASAHQGELRVAANSPTGAAVELRLPHAEVA